MKKRIVISLVFLAFGMVQAQRLARLPDCFHVVGQEKNSSLFDPSNNIHQIVFVLVPAAAESFTKDNKAHEVLKKFTNNNKIKVPYSFFSANSPSKTTYPLCVYFDWLDTSPSTNKLNTPAYKLAEGLDYLHSLKSKCIVVTQGRGGLVFNAATHQLKKPVQVAIQLGTPIPQETKYASFMPNTDKIGQLYTLYSQQPFAFNKPTLHPRYAYEYSSLKNNDHYSVLLLINNKQPQQSGLYANVVGKNILPLCHEIKKNFKVNKNLFASISPLKKETNLLVAINTPAQDLGAIAQEEQALSNRQKRNFTLAWKRAPELNLSTGARTRSLHRYKKA
jgi:hypothetical protein